jgi:hypothetical protein
LGLDTGFRVALTHSAIRSRVERAFRYWRPLLGLESWGIEIRWDEREALGACAAKPAYEEATLYFNVRRIRAELLPTYAAVEELTLHEMLHCILWRCNERTVSRITRALLRAHGRI